MYLCLSCVKSGLSLFAEIHTDSFLVSIALKWQLSANAQFNLRLHRVIYVLEQLKLRKGLCLYLTKVLLKSMDFSKQ